MSKFFEVTEDEVQVTVVCQNILFIARNSNGSCRIVLRNNGWIHPQESYEEVVNLLEGN